MFDIDDTICYMEDSRSGMRRELVPGEQIFQMRLKGDVYFAFCVPHLKELFKYLFLQDDMRIVFFSSAVRDRNECLVEQFFIGYYGEDKYVEMKQMGLIEVYSREDLIDGSEPGEGNRLRI